MATLKERRKSDRERQRRWKARQKAEGKKNITAMISLKSQLILNREKRRTGQSTSAIIEKAILLLAE